MKNTDAIQSLRRLKPSSSTDYAVRVVGNDPFFQIPNPIKTDQPSVVVATSGARVLQLACELRKSNAAPIPKIFLVDNSDKVIEFWKQLKIIFAKYKTYDAKHSSAFWWWLTGYSSCSGDLLALLKNSKLCGDFLEVDKNADNVKLPYLSQQNTLSFFESLIKKYSYATVRDMVNEVELVKQPWENKKPFECIRQFCQDNGINNIMVYASNIVGYLQYFKLYKAANHVRENIELLQPTSIIHTDDCYDGLPRSVYICNDAKTQITFFKNYVGYYRSRFNADNPFAVRLCEEAGEYIEMRDLKSSLAKFPRS